MDRVEHVIGKADEIAYSPSERYYATTLSIYGCCPKNIPQLYPNVTRLTLHNSLKHIPPWVFFMRELQSLHIECTGLVRFPASLGSFTLLPALGTIRFNTMHLDAVFKEKVKFCPLLGQLQVAIGEYFGPIEAKERAAVAMIIISLRKRTNRDIAVMIAQMVWESYVEGDAILNNLN